ncbi:hypothetical protein TNCV_2988141 [Trichonephila clavipes]|nr:hypothetical protein TNCV_2988141 [Trichonephila clavipes]
MRPGIILPQGNVSRMTFVVRYKNGEQTIPVTVVLDYKKQTEYVINMSPRATTKTVTLYDFKQVSQLISILDFKTKLQKYLGFWRLLMKN